MPTVKANNVVISTYSHCKFTHLISQLFFFFVVLILSVAYFPQVVLYLPFSFPLRHCWRKERLVISMLRLLRNAVSDEMRAVIASLKECSHNILWQSLKCRQGWDVSVNIFAFTQAQTSVQPTKTEVSSVIEEDIL